MFPPCRSLIFFTATTAFASGAVDFSHQIVPIIREHCSECHTGDKKKGGLSMNDRKSLIDGSENGPVVVLGQSAKSSLIEAVTSTDPDVQMPPKGKRIPAEQVALLKQWIDEGLVWEEGFAFKKPAYEPPLKPRKPELPVSVDGRTHPVDRIIDAYLAQKKLKQPQPINDATFARRVHLDLVGLLPKPEVLEKFLADKSPEKRTKLIESLLGDDTAYAEHWLTFWNDLLRNDYSGTGFITGGRKQISKWLYESLVTNKPFDQFTRELIAPPTPQSRGYIDGIKWRGDVSAGQTVEIQFAQSVSQSFLGINMKCASCHDSFIDRWKLDEAYGLAAIYSSRPLDIARCDKSTGRTAVASWLFPEIGQVDPKAAPDARLKQLAELMTSPQNGRFSRTIVNRLWQRLMGRGIVHPVDAMQTEPWSADLLDHLATQLVESRYDLRKVLAHLASSQAYQSKSQVIEAGQDDHGYVFAGPRAKRMTAEQFVDAVWTLTGVAPTKIDAPVLRGKVDIEAGKSVKLAGKWIWGDSAKGPTAPAAGETIQLRKAIKLDGAIQSSVGVITCDNEYKLHVNNRLIGEDPNWETVEAYALNDSLRTGQNTITVIAKNAGKGPNAAGLFFEARVKLADGKVVTIATDESWQSSNAVPNAKEGRLGAGAKKEEWNSAQVIAKPVGSWVNKIEAEAPGLLASTSIGKQPMVRASLVKSDFLMRTLGRPNRDQIVSTRPNDLTTLEAIDLANGQTLANYLANGAKTFSPQKWPDSKALTTHLYRHALSRDPTPNELAATLELLGPKPTDQGAQDLLWAICMMPEFQFVR